MGYDREQHAEVIFPNDSPLGATIGGSHLSSPSLGDKVWPDGQTTVNLSLAVSFLLSSIDWGNKHVKRVPGHCRPTSALLPTTPCQCSPEGRNCFKLFASRNIKLNDSITRRFMGAMAQQRRRRLPFRNSICQHHHHPHDRWRRRIAPLLSLSLSPRIPPGPTSTIKRSRRIVRKY